MMAAAPKRPRMARDNRRQQLLAVANRIVAEEGVPALTMERLAVAAVISKPVVYSHFDNRSALLVAMLDDHWRNIDAAVPRAPDEGEAYPDFIRRSIRAYLDTIQAGGSTVRTFLYRGCDDPAVEAARREREAVVVRLWTDRLPPHYGINRADAEVLNALYRASVETAAARVVRDPRDRRRIERIVVAMAIASLEALSRR